MKKRELIKPIVVEEEKVTEQHLEATLKALNEEKQKHNFFTTEYNYNPPVNYFSTETIDPMPKKTIKWTARPPELEDPDYYDEEPQLVNNEYNNQMKIVKDQFIKYENDPTVSSLLIFLLKSQIINSNSNVVLEHNIIHEKINADRIKKDIRNFKNSIEEWGINVDINTLNNITQLVNILYSGEGADIVFMYITNKYTFNTILVNAVEKNINIDPEFKKGTTLDFVNMRRNNHQGMCAVYVPMLNEIILISLSKNIMINYDGFEDFMDKVNKKESIPSSLDNIETITIDNIEYSKKSFESIVECSFSEFISNLHIESILDGQIKKEAVGHVEYL